MTTTIDKWRHAWRSAMVIARRDYVSTVWSRYFLLFLFGPLMAGAFSGGAAILGGKSDAAALRPRVAVVAGEDVAVQMHAAVERLGHRLGAQTFPELRYVRPAADEAAQVRGLLAGEKAMNAVLTGVPAAPLLHGPKGQIDQVEGDIGLILDTRASMAALGAALGDNAAGTAIAPLARRDAAEVGGGTRSARQVVARGAQMVLFFLTLMLAGMMLSNLTEEKSNKVIEVLAAALPVDRIFMGKLIGMVAVSLTGIAIWGALIGAALIYAAQDGAAIGVPAVGWPLMVVLGIAYFVMNYMIIGGIFLGIGAQAATVREVQTLSMPVTMGQLGLFAMTSAAQPGGHTLLARVTEVFPLSSPLAMIGRAAVDGALWPHLLALAWQGLWVVLIVRFAAARFRSGVLKSGSPPDARASRWRIGRRAPARAHAGGALLHPSR